MRTKHWIRWIPGAVVIFVVAQLVWTLFTNAGYGWPTVAKYFFSPAILRGLGIESVGIVPNAALEGGEYGEVLERWGLASEALTTSEINPPGLPKS